MLLGVRAFSSCFSLRYEYLSSFSWVDAASSRVYGLFWDKSEVRWLVMKVSNARVTLVGAHLGWQWKRIFVGGRGRGCKTALRATIIGGEPDPKAIVWHRALSTPERATD